MTSGHSRVFVNCCCAPCSPPPPPTSFLPNIPAHRNSNGVPVLPKPTLHQLSKFAATTAAAATARPYRSRQLSMCCSNLPQTTPSPSPPLHLSRSLYDSYDSGLIRPLAYIVSKCFAMSYLTPTRSNGPPVHPPTHSPPPHPQPHLLACGLCVLAPAATVRPPHPNSSLAAAVTPFPIPLLDLGLCSPQTKSPDR